MDATPLAEEVERLYLRGCNGCELKLARRLGAQFAGIGWVQKVSNLILNINLQVRDVTSGRLTHAGTVDIRGNTDEILAARTALPARATDLSPVGGAAAPTGCDQSRNARFRLRASVEALDGVSAAQAA